MRALIIGPYEKAKIAALIALAETNVVPFARMLRLRDACERGGGEAVRDMNIESSIRIPEGYQVTLTYEEHAPGVVCRHFSVSVGPPTGRPLGPSPEGVAFLMKEFGFVNDLGTALAYGLVWQEQLEEGRWSINVVEPLDGDIEKLPKKEPA